MMSAYTKRDEGFIGALESEGVIFLNNNFRLGRDDYMLAHELTHFQQFESGENWPRCRMEAQAYKVQAAFVIQTGTGKKGDPLTVMLASDCGNE